MCSLASTVVDDILMLPRSLLGAGDCNLDIRTPNSTEVYIQLLQLSDYNYAEVIQCKVEISRTSYYCGMHSHISLVHNGLADYIQEVGYTRCSRMFQDGTISLGIARFINGLKPNQTTTRSITLAGLIGDEWSCKGTQYFDPYGTWNNVIVQALARITLKNAYVPVHLNSGKIILKSRTSCTLTEGFCIDPDDGYTYWKPSPTSTCNFHRYNVLYEEATSKITEDISLPTSPIVYSLTTHDITFALTKTKEQSLCGYTLHHTEHPKLFILETKKGDTLQRNRTDWQFGYIRLRKLKICLCRKTHQKSNDIALHNVMQQRCELKREIIKNTLSFATLQLDEFAYRLMKGPGYMAVTAGKATHVEKCILVDVLLWKTKECYIELPVTLRNASFFPNSKVKEPHQSRNRERMQ